MEFCTRVAEHNKAPLMTTLTDLPDDVLWIILRHVLKLYTSRRETLNCWCQDHRHVLPVVNDSSGYYSGADTLVACTCDECVLCFLTCPKVPLSLIAKKVRQCLKRRCYFWRVPDSHRFLRRWNFVPGSFSAVASEESIKYWANYRSSDVGFFP